MSSSFEKSVKGATKIKLAPPKSKYIEHILVATHAGEAGVAEVFRALQHRLRDSTWTIVFKSLIVVHLLIREGAADVTLRHLAKAPQRSLAINNFTEVQTQGRNIKTYAEYLLQRAVSYGQTKCDYVRTADDGRLKRMTVEKGLLRETEAAQDQIRALLRCDFFSGEAENDITLTAFRFLILDLINLYYVMNEGTVNVIEHFLEMSKPDAERAVNIYKTFCKQTERVVNYLSMARHYENATRLEIPKMKHAPTNLISSMEDYLKDANFETNRRQYLAEQQNKKKGGINASDKTFTASKSSFPSKSAQSISNSFSPTEFPTAPSKSTASAGTKGPAPDLIDFFESIEQNQTSMAQTQYQPQQQMQTGFAQQTPYGGTSGAVPMQQQLPTGNTNPFLQMQQNQVAAQPNMNQLQQIQPNFTGAGFGGYTSMPQQTMSTGFAPSLSTIPQSSATEFSQYGQQLPTQAMASTQSTGINPFRQSMMPNATGTTVASFQSTPTGSTTSTFPSSISTNRQSTNPFAKPADPSSQAQQSFGYPSQQQQFGQSGISSSAQHTGQTPAFGQPQHQQFQPQHNFTPQQQPAPLAPTATGTNPFARAPVANANSPFSSHQSDQPSPISTTVTGATNPFRQSQFVNQQTGQGWQNSQQGTIGGYSSDQIGTMPIFPRPGQPPQQQQASQQAWPQS